MNPPSVRSAVAGCLLLALGAAGCSGIVGDAPGLPDAGPRLTVSNPGPLLLRRLTNTEYDHVVRDLLGQTESVSGDFPADPKVGNFDNNAASLTVSELAAERYRDAAETIAAAVIASPARRAAVVGCDPSGEQRDACLRSFITTFGRRAFRRPVTATEMQGLLAVASAAADDPDPNMGAALVIETVLQSPSFLFRTEFGVADPLRAGLHKLGGVDLAARLAFFFWDTTPDDALLARAQSGALDTVDGLTATARAMLADPRARDGIAEFYNQWLAIYTLDEVHRDTTEFPAWTPALVSSMKGETAHVLDDLIWRDGANFLDLLTSNNTFVDPTLAAFYGVPAPADGQWTRTTMPAATGRTGLLTQASYLTLSAHTPGSTLIHRGKYVREVLLCETLPSPPANVPTIPDALPGESDVDRLARHRSDPSCNGCHRRMDPVGMGMRHFDGIGAFHLLDDQMQPIAQNGQLYGFTPEDFDGPMDLSQRLRNAPEVTQCVARQVFRYAFGRAEVLGASDDGPSIDRAVDRFRASGYSFRELLIATVTSDAFRYGQEGGH